MKTCHVEEEIVSHGSDAAGLAEMMEEVCICQVTQQIWKVYPAVNNIYRDDKPPGKIGTNQKEQE